MGKDTFDIRVEDLGEGMEKIKNCLVYLMSNGWSEHEVLDNGQLGGQERRL